MSRYNNKNIDRKTNKPYLEKTNSANSNDTVLRRSSQLRRDEDVIRTPKRTLYDIDYAIKWFIDNEIQPKITEKDKQINVPVVFSNGEKWENVRKLGYMRDEKGMLQSPIIAIKRMSVTERDDLRKLDVNRTPVEHQIVYKSKYNNRNRYIDELFPLPDKQEPTHFHVINIPEYVNVEYEILIWTDFTTQMNDVIDQIMPYKGMAWGNDHNKFMTLMPSFNFETINVPGEDRIVRATTTITVKASLLAEQEFRENTLKTAYSMKKLSFDNVLDIEFDDLFKTTAVPQKLAQQASKVFAGSVAYVNSGNGTSAIDSTTMTYLTSLTDVLGTVVTTSEVSFAKAAAINPVNNLAATKDEFDVYINGQYIHKSLYTWVPTITTPQTVTFLTGSLGYNIFPEYSIIINGRWA